MSVKLTVDIAIEMEGAYGLEPKFVHVHLSKLVAPEITKVSDVGLTAVEQLSALVSQLTSDAVKEAQQQTRGVGEHYHRTVHAMADAPA